MSKKREKKLQHIFKKGDVVKVYSLQSFFHGGFINGEEGIVSQDQNSGSVLVAVKRKIDGKYKIDSFYEVYPEQLRLQNKNISSNHYLVDQFERILSSIREG